jgi:FMN-dependent oxidoreductase (nitrilotriacetate monooxygenase family)
VSEGRGHFHLSLVPTTNTLHDGWETYARQRGIGHLDAVDHYLQCARLAEEGNFTLVFLGDTASAVSAPVADTGAPEPVTSLTAIAAVTRNLGLVGTISTTFYEPYNVARLIGSLDQISGGRAGWNAVTSATEAAALNFSYDAHLPRETRYEIADEFIEVVNALMRNRELRCTDDGVPRYYARPIDHVGKYFRVKGPLNVAPSRQGRPLLAQAGGSGPGIRVGAKHADIIFTNANSQKDAATYRAALDAALVEVGRAPRSVPVLPGVSPYLGRTKAEAISLKRELDAFLDVEALAPAALAAFGIEYSYRSVDDPFPVDVLPDPARAPASIRNSLGNYTGLYTWITERPGVTVREVVGQTAGGWTHRNFVGSYDEFADEIESWYREGLADGFSILAPRGIESVRECVEEIVPRLIDRGIYRAEPDERPLRHRFTARGGM